MPFEHFPKEYAMNRVTRTIVCTLPLLCLAIGAIPARAGDNSPAGLAMMQTYLDLIDHFSKLAKDPAAAGVAATIGATDMLKAKSPDDAIKFLEETLPNVKNQAVQRVIRFQLIELYKSTGDQDKALEQMKALMTGAPVMDEQPAGK
jgi:Tetratricopeptide repeat-like domain